MNQLETAGALPAAWLPFADIASPEPQPSAQACPDDAPTGEPAPSDPILYVSPPQMPWPRVFPDL